MPRRKRTLVEVEGASDQVREQNETSQESMGLRRSTRQKIVQPLKKDIDSKPVNKSTLKASRGSKKDSVSKQQLEVIDAQVVLKRIEVNDENCTTDLDHGSPGSTDSGIASWHSTKDESNLQTFGPARQSKVTKTLLEKSKTTSDDLKDKTDSNKQVKKLKSKQKSKRKIDDLIDKKVEIDTVKSSAPRKKSFKKTKKEDSLSLEPKRDSSGSADNTNICGSSDKKESVMQVLTQLEFSNPNNVQSETVDQNAILSSNDSSSDSDWEEVEEQKEQNLEDYKPEIPKDGVEITIDCPEIVRKRKKKQNNEMDLIRLYINRMRKEQQLNIHKSHLLCLLAHGFYVNDVLNSSILKALALSLIPPDVLGMTSGKKIDKIGPDGIGKIISWFQDTFTFENEQLPFLNIQSNLCRYFQDRKSLNATEYNLIFIVIARTLGLKTRLCISFYPVTYKAQNLLKKPTSKKKKVSETIEDKEEKCQLEGTSKSNLAEKEENKKSMPKPSKKAQVSRKKEKQESVKGNKKSITRRSTKKNYKLESDDDEDFDIDNEEEDEDFEDKVKKSKPTRKSQSSSKKKSDRSVLSSDSDSSFLDKGNFTLDKITCWAEVFSKQNKSWISVECANNILNKPYDIETLLPQPVTYIVAFDNSSHAKDVTKRYCNEYMTSTIKLRRDSEWWEDTLEPFLPPNTKLEKEEEKKLEEILINKPFPTTISGFKNHPLYALKRHLLKYEAIYPPDAAPVGFIRKEPIYARDNVCQLHTREIWFRDARVVRMGEEPYKVVRARPTWDKVNKVIVTDKLADVFGFWQTDPYEPPVAVGGKVPRNEYGNVDLYKPSMLPKGTVHLKNPGLNRIAKKLGIDGCAAFLGFEDFHPVYDGFVVCSEYKDTLLAAWEEEQVNAEKRREEKRDKRIYGNWRKLIRGLLIKERIKLKYDVK